VGGRLDNNFFLFFFCVFLVEKIPRPFLNFTPGPPPPPPPLGITKASI